MLTKIAVIFPVRAVLVMVKSVLFWMVRQPIGKCFPFLLGQRVLVLFHTFLRLQCYVLLHKRVKRRGEREEKENTELLVVVQAGK